MKIDQYWLDYNIDIKINYFFLYLAFIAIDSINIFSALFINKKYILILLIIDLISIGLLFPNKKLKKYFIAIISLFLNPILRLLFPTSLFLFYIANGFNKNWFLTITLAHLLSLLLTVILKNKLNQKTLNILGSNFIFFIAIIIIVLIPSKFAIRFADDLFRLILNHRIVIGFMIIDFVLNLALISAIKLKLIQYRDKNRGSE